MGVVHNPPIIPDAVDTIVESRRFYASMSGIYNSWWFENGTDYFDSRARWDASSREFVAGGFRISPIYSTACWVAPFACRLKGFIAHALISSDDLGFKIGLFYKDPTLGITGTNTTLEAVVSTSSNNTEDELEEVTGTCDIALSAGDWVLPAVSRDGYTSTETIYGTVSFWVERD